MPPRLPVTGRAGVAFAAYMAAGAGLGVFDEGTWRGGLTVEALVSVALESTVTGPVWLLGVAQRHLERPFGWARSALSRSAYGAFIGQGLVSSGSQWRCALCR